MNTREKLKPYLPFFILFLLMLAAHGSVSYGRDDVLFRSVLDVTDGFSFLVDRWYTWSSRSIIEGVMISILDIDRFPLWKLLNCFLFLLLPWVICRLTGNEKPVQTRFHWFVVGLILLYPYGYDMSTSGWAATTMNYFWPLVFALAGMLPIRIWLEGKTLRWYVWPAIIPAVLYAANAEQTCVILLVVYTVFFLRQTAIRKTVNLQMLVLLGLTLVSLAWILCCPGNQVRKTAELYRFTEYPMLGFADKLDLALSSTMSQLIGRPHLLFLFFTVMLADAVWKKEQAVLFRIIAAFPAACCLVFGMFGEQTASLFPELSRLMRTTGQGVITVDNYFLYKSYLPLFVMGGVILCVLISFYLVFYESSVVGSDSGIRDLAEYVRISEEQKCNSEMDSLDECACTAEEQNADPDRDALAECALTTEERNADPDRDALAECVCMTEKQKQSCHNMQTGSGRNGIFENRKQFSRQCLQRGVLAIFVFLLGLGSRAMMAFSPTVWASNTRTNIYLDFSIIILCCLLYRRTEENAWGRENRLEWFLGMLAVFSYGMQFAAM